MALIEISTTQASMFKVDPDWSISSNGELVEGRFYGLSVTTGYVAKPSSTVRPVGIAADSKSGTAAYMPYTTSVVVNRFGDTRATQNRVNDFYDETLASGKMTMYTGTGEFWTDQYDAASATAYAPGKLLYVKTDGKLTVHAADTAFAAATVGFVVEGPQEYPSGIPGVNTDGSGNEITFTETDGSVTLGTMLRFVMSFGI